MFGIGRFRPAVGSTIIEVYKDGHRKGALTQVRGTRLVVGHQLVVTRCLSSTEIAVSVMSHHGRQNGAATLQIKSAAYYIEGEILVVHRIYPATV